MCSQEPWACLHLYSPQCVAQSSQSRDWKTAFYVLFFDLYHTNREERRATKWHWISHENCEKSYGNSRGRNYQQHSIMISKCLEGNTTIFGIAIALDNLQQVFYNIYPWKTGTFNSVLDSKFWETWLTPWFAHLNIQVFHKYLWIENLRHILWPCRTHIVGNFQNAEGFSNNWSTNEKCQLCDWI